MAHISARPTSIAGSAGGAGAAAGSGDNATSASVEDALQGYSTSSSSSIYQHPFASFNFGPPPSSFSAKANHDDDVDPSATLSSRLNAMSVSPKHAFTRLDPNHSGSTNHSVPPSPSTSYADSQHSMDEYDLDSPSSLSSWNSFHSGYRGDLADVEDLELGEPELETVSELDEDNYNVGNDSPVLESDDDQGHSQPPCEGAKFGENLARRRTITSHGQYHSHQHAAQGFHGLSHFSPRNGGHGLSHHSRWTSRAPASLVARRRKGRIAELAEEGAGEAPGINTTMMPAKDQTSASSERSSASASGASSPLSSGNGSHGHSASPPGRCDGNYPGTPPAAHWAEFAGPPPLPVRSISPSETVPAVPSPLCECINASIAADGQDAVAPSPSTPVGGQPPELETPTASRMTDNGRVADDVLPAPTPRRGVFEAETAYALTCKESHSPPSTPEKGTVSGRSAVQAPSSPDTTPPTSPVQPLLRRNSRPRRSSSPVHVSKTKMPLRPCFSRRNSAQSGQSTRDSSLERGRCHVRFSPAPPQTIRTHSPVDYDRSSCPVNNRLSVEDVEEMQKMDMEMGLLSAKCSAIAALTSCKLPKKPDSDPYDGKADTSSLSSSSSSPPEERTQHLAAPGPDAVVDRPRRESTGGLTGHYDPRAAAPRPASKSAASLSPAEHLRLQRERERERACRMAGIGTGLGGRNLGNGVRGQSTNPLIARFGLTTPPPPLPSSKSVGQLPRPSAPPSVSDAGGAQPSCQPPPQSSQSQPQSPSRARSPSVDRDSTLSPSRTRAIRASSLHRTPSEERASRRSLAPAPAESDRGDHVAAQSPARGRAPAKAGLDISQESETSSLPSLALTSPSPPPSPTSTRGSQESCEQKSAPWARTQSNSYFPAPAASQQAPSASRGRGGPRSCGGYDSPGSAYESGSEYDLIG